MQELIDKIKKDGVASAEKEAQNIISAAEAKAKDIEKAAQAKADDIIKAAKAETERMEKASEEAVMQASRNMLLSFKDSLVKELDGLIQADTAKAETDALAKLGFDIERKRIELGGITIKTVGNYKATVKLYEAQVAEIHFSVIAQEEEKKEEAPKANKGRRAPKAEETKAEEAPVEESAAE